MLVMQRNTKFNSTVRCWKQDTLKTSHPSKWMIQHPCSPVLSYSVTLRVPQCYGVSPCLRSQEARRASISRSQVPEGPRLLVSLLLFWMKTKKRQKVRLLPLGTKIMYANYYLGGWWLSWFEAGHQSATPVLNTGPVSLFLHQSHQQPSLTHLMVHFKLVSRGPSTGNTIVSTKPPNITQNK